MSTPPVSIVPILAAPADLAETVAVLVSHRIRHRIEASPQTAYSLLTADPPIMIIVQGGAASEQMLRAVEQLSSGARRPPVLVLADNVSEAEEGRLLVAGARDVMSTRVSPTRLRMRILAIRRAVALGEADKSMFQRGPLAIHTGRREARLSGQSLQLTRREFDLLVALARDPRRVVTRDELADHLSVDGDSRAIDSHVSRLRTKVRLASGSPLIEPVRGVGYRLGVSVA